MTARSEEILALARIGAVLLGARTVVMQFVVLGGNVYLTRRLSPDDFGGFAVVQSALLFFELLGDGGLGAALVSSKEMPDRRTMSSVFWLQAMLASGVVALAWALADVMRRVWTAMPPEGPWLLRALSLTMLLTVLRTPCGIQMERRLQFGRIAVIDVVRRLVYFTVAVLLARAGFGLKALLAGVLAEATTAAILAYALSPFRPAWVLDRERLGPIIRFGVAVQSRGFIGYVNGAITPLFAGALLGRHALGLNNWAQGFAYFPLEAVNIISRVSYPVLSQIRDDAPALRRALEQSMQGVALVSCFFTGLVWGIGPAMVRVVYTDQWLPAMDVLLVYSTAMIVGTMSPLLASALDAIGRPGIVARLSAGWVTLNWIVVVVVMKLSPGLTHYAMAHCVHVVVGNVALLAIVQRQFPGLRTGRAFVTPVLAGLAVVAAGRLWLRGQVGGPFTLAAVVLAAAAL
ncbi:MAG: hypothetical protein EOO75_13715, partial [Myxococcales bacterium]